MSRPGIKPYDLEAARARLSVLPGDDPPREPAADRPPPMDYALEEARFLEERPEPPPPALAPGRRRFWTLGTGFTLFAVLFAIGFLAYHAVRTVIDAFAWWAPSGVLLALLLAAAVLCGLVAIARELGVIRRQLRSLDTIAAARREADQLMQSQGHDRGVAFAARVIGLYESRPEMAGPIREFRQAVNSTLRDQEVVARLSSLVLRHLDEEARGAVGRALRDTAFISLASPNGLIDGLITFWRELRMLREVAVVYGLAPGLLQQWTLLRRVLFIAATSGMLNQAGDMAMQSLGGGMVARLSANAADALYTALRTARLGIYAMEVCRPVAFAPAERRSMWIFLRKAARSALTLIEGGAGRAAGPDRAGSAS